MTLSAYPDKFTSADETVEYDFPRRHLRFHDGGGLRVPRASVAGAHYGVRLIGERPALKDVGRLRLSFLLYGSEAAELAEMKSKLHIIGLGKLWWTDGTWGWASVTDMPEVSMQWDRPGVLAVDLGFDVWSDWYGDPVSVTQNVTTNGQEWTVANPGLPNDQMTILLTPLVSAGINAPKITNLTTGAELETSFVSSSTNHRRRLLTGPENGPPRFEGSTNGGSTWFNAHASYVTPPSQPSLTFRLAAGNNTFKLEGTSPNVNVAVSFFERVS